MSFPTAISDVITSIAGGALTLLGNTVVDYWPYLVGLAILTGLAWKFRKMFRVAR